MEPLTDLTFEDKIEPKTFEEAVGSTEALDKTGAGYSPIGQPMQSSNFVHGITGWRLDSNGNLEANDGLFRGQFDIGGTNITIDNTKDIQETIDYVYEQGGGTIYLQPGEYVLQDDIDFKSGVSLVGTNVDTCIINNNRNYSILVNGTDQYNTGSITIAYGETVITGTDTVWTTSMEGQTIFAGNYYYEIDTVDSETSITLKTPYYGDDLTNAHYLICTPVSSTKISTLTILDADNYGLYTSGSKYLILDNVNFIDCGTGICATDSYTISIIGGGVSVINCGRGIDFNYAYAWTISNTTIDTTTVDYGLRLFNSGDSTFFNASIFTAMTDGIYMEGCSDISFMSFTISGNGNNGITLYNSNYDTQFVSGAVNFNTNDGINIGTNSSRIVLSSMSVSDNGGYGINITDPTDENNQIVTPAFENNTAGNINDLGTNTTILPNNTIEILADEDITIGNAVTTNINSKIVRSYRNQSIGITTFSGQLNGQNQNAMCALDDNKFVIIDTVSADDSLYAVVGTVDFNTKSIDSGEVSTAVTADVTSGQALVVLNKLDTNKFVVFYIEDANNAIIKYRVGNVSGTTITWGSATTFYTAGTNVDSISSCQIGTNKGIVVFSCATATDSKVIAYTVSGTTITAGTAKAISTNIDAKNVSSVKLDTDKFMIISQGTGYAQVGTISGTTITLGSDSSFASASYTSMTYEGIFSPNTNVVVISYYKSGTGRRYIAGTISGTTITWGTELSITGGFGQGAGGAYIESTTSFLVRSGTTVIRLTLSGTTLTYGGIVEDLTSAGYTILQMPGGYYIIPTSSTNLKAYIQGMSYTHVGFAQNTASKGGLVTVRTSGYDYNQSSLSPGVKYMVSNGGLSTITWSGSVSTINDLNYKHVLAISPTSIFMDI